MTHSDASVKGAPACRRMLVPDAAALTVVGTHLEGSAAVWFTSVQERVGLDDHPGTSAVTVGPKSP